MNEDGNGDLNSLILTRHFNCTFRQDSQDFIAECPQICFQDRYEAFQIGLQAAGAFLTNTKDERLQTVLDFLIFRIARETTPLCSFL